MKKRISRHSVYFFTLLLVIALSVLGFSITASSQGVSPAVSPSPTATPPPDGDIVDIAMADGRFSILVTALQEAGLVDTLRGPGPFTVFAPTDEAFNKLPPGAVTALLDDVPTLENILLYHVVSGNILSTDILNVTTAGTVQGGSIKIGLTVNGADVIIPDIMASNGVIHAIDMVLIPIVPPASPTPMPTP